MSNAGIWVFFKILEKSSNMNGTWKVFEYKKKVSIIVKQGKTIIDIIFLLDKIFITKNTKKSG